MMELRKKIFITVGIAAGIIIAAILLYFLFSKKEIILPQLGLINKPDNIPQETFVVKESVKLSDVNQPKTETPASVDNVVPGEIYAKQLAIIFVETFATYSNQNNNSHIGRVLPMLTPQMAAWVNTQRQGMSEVYSGVTTRVIASRVEKIDDKSAVVAVDTQQVFSTSASQEIKQRSGRVDVLQVGDEWKIDGFFWDK